MTDDGFSLGTFNVDGGVRWPGIVKDQRVYRLADVADNDSFLAGCSTLLEVLDRWDEALPLLATATERIPHALEIDAALAHLPFTPRQYFGVIDDWRQSETHHPVTPTVFVGLHSAIAGPARLFRPSLAPYPIRPGGALAVVLGRPAHRVKASDAMAHVAGYMLAADMTAIEPVGQTSYASEWSRTKGAPGSKVLGPFLTPKRFAPDPPDLALTVTLDGFFLEEVTIGAMRFSIAEVIEYVSGYASLYPGDVILTGIRAQNLSDGRTIGAESILEIESPHLGKQKIVCGT